jgi:hypothetical protein
VALSEREVHARMAAAGRPVSLLTISEWRRCGLMPPLATSSLGRNKGKICYWTDDNTFERATLIYDLFEKGVERHEVYWLLWLCGLSVPLPQLRRAWLHKAKDRNTRVAVLRDPPQALVVDKNKPSVDGTAQVLFEIALAASALLDHASDCEIDALVEAMTPAQITGGRGRAVEERYQAVRLVKAVWSSLKTSDIIIEATDDELREAQMHASAALRSYHARAPERGLRLAPNASDWPIAEAGRFGAPLFFLILAFHKSGQRALLEYIVRPATIAKARKGLEMAPEASPVDLVSSF